MTLHCAILINRPTQTQRLMVLRYRQESPKAPKRQLFTTTIHRIALAAQTIPPLAIHVRDPWLISFI